MQLDFECITQASPNAVFKGKVRKAALCPSDGDIAVIASYTSDGGGELHLWSISGHKSLHDVKMKSPVLDIQWTTAPLMNFFILLTEEGEQIVYTHNSLELVRHPRRSAMIHPHSGAPHLHGCLSSLEEVVVSTIGDTTFLARNWTKQLSRSPPVVHSTTLNSRIDSLRLIDPRRVLISSREEPKILEYELLNSSPIRSIDLGFFPILWTYNPSRKEIAILDIERTLHFIDLSTAACSFREKLNFSDQDDKPVPVYLALAQDGHLLGAVSGAQAKIYTLSSNEINKWETDIMCVRPYALLMSCTSFAIIHMPNWPKDVEIPRKRGHTWSVQTWQAKSLERSVSPPEQNDVVYPGDPPDPTATWNVEPERVQNGLCAEQSDLAPCKSCQEYQASSSSLPLDLEECRFHNFRIHRPSGALDVGDPELFRHQISENANTVLRFDYNEWSPSRSIYHATVMKEIARKFLLPRLEKEYLHLQKPGFHRRTFNINVNVVCDCCFHSIFFEVWFCKFCGLEVCKQCFDNFPATSDSSNIHEGISIEVHAQDHFFPVSFFDEGDIQGSIQSILSIGTDSDVPHLWKSFSPTPEPTPPIQRFPVQSMSEERFAALWAKGAPFIVTGVCEPQTPVDAMGLDHGSSHPCEVQQFLDSGPVIVNSTLEDYFKTWHEHQEVPRQVRDYPPNGSLQDVHPRVAEEFYLLLAKIAPSFLCPRGPMNLASYWPKQSNAPDMGPKVYIAEADSASQGTTDLHMDKSGAVNLMLHSSSPKARKGARWEIWPQHSTRHLSKLVSPSSTQEECEMGLPVLSTHYYLHDDIGYQNIQAPWSFIQQPGDAVFIPPLCLHQVTNLGHCVKIAVDFISPSDIASLKLLADKFRAVNLHLKRPEHVDLVNLDMTLWFAWRSTFH